MFIFFELGRDMDKEKPFASKSFILKEEMDILSNHKEKENNEKAFDMDTLEPYDNITNVEFMELLKINPDDNVVDKYCSNSQTYCMTPEYTTAQTSSSPYPNGSGHSGSMQFCTNASSSNEIHEHILQEQVVTLSETSNNQESQDSGGNSKSSCHPFG